MELGCRVIAPSAKDPVLNFNVPGESPRCGLYLGRLRYHSKAGCTALRYFKALGEDRALGFALSFDKT